VTEPTPEDDPERTFDIPPPAKDDSLEASLDTVLEDARSVPTILTPREDGRPAAPPPRERRASTSLNRDAVEAAVRKGLITRIQGTSFLERSGSDSDVLEVMVDKGLLEADAAEQLREEVAEDFVPGYRVVDELGRGGMGVVYRAVHRSLNRQVALKVITPELRLSREHADRFKREAQTLAALNHPHIVQVYDTGEVGDKLYISLELVDGEDLGEYVKRKQRLGWREATEVVLDAARGLGHAYASDAKVIHRDVKPGNLLRAKVAGFSRHLTKVTDLGLARMRGDQSGGRQTKAGTIMGSPSYMAPEQASGDPVDHRADIYSLGATYYHFLVGEPPFVGQVVQVLRARLSGEQVASPGDRVEGIPAAVQRVIDRMLAQEPEHRYPTYDALIADLEAVHAGQVPHAPRVPREASSLTFAGGDAPELGGASAAATEVMAAAAPPAGKASGGGTAVLGFLLLLGAIVGGLYLTQSGPAEPPPRPDDVSPVETTTVGPPPVEPTVAIREQITGQLETLAGLAPDERLAVEDPGALWTRLDELPPLERAPLRVRLEELARETVESAVARATALHADADYVRLREVCAAARLWATAAELELGGQLEILEDFAEQGCELGSEERATLEALLNAADAKDHAAVLKLSEGFAERYAFSPDLARVDEARAAADAALPLLELISPTPGAQLKVDGIAQDLPCRVRVERGAEVVCTLTADRCYPLRRVVTVDASRSLELRPSARSPKLVRSKGGETSLFGQVGPTTKLGPAAITKRGWTVRGEWTTQRDADQGVFAWHTQAPAPARLIYRPAQDQSPLGAQSNLASRVDVMFSLMFGLRLPVGGRLEVRLLADGSGAELTRQVALRIEGTRIELGSWHTPAERFVAEAIHDLAESPQALQLDWDGSRVVMHAGTRRDKRALCSFAPDWTPLPIKDDELQFLAQGPFPAGESLVLINPALNPLVGAE